MFLRRQDLKGQTELSCDCQYCHQYKTCKFYVVASDRDAKGNPVDNGRTHLDVLMSVCNACRAKAKTSRELDRAVKEYDQWLEKNTIKGMCNHDGPCTHS
jgi:hypothetical protein